MIPNADEDGRFAYEVLLRRRELKRDADARALAHRRRRLEAAEAELQEVLAEHERARQAVSDAWDAFRLGPADALPAAARRRIDEAAAAAEHVARRVETCREQVDIDRYAVEESRRMLVRREQQLEAAQSLRVAYDQGVRTEDARREQLEQEDDQTSRLSRRPAADEGAP